MCFRALLKYSAKKAELFQRYFYDTFPNCYVLKLSLLFLPFLLQATKTVFALLRLFQSSQNFQKHNIFENF